MKEASEIMAQKSICVLGNGACPPECPLTEDGKKFFAGIPTGTDLIEAQREIRRKVILADARFQEVNVVDVARVMSACIKERPLE